MKIRIIGESKGFIIQVWYKGCWLHINEVIVEDTDYSFETLIDAEDAFIIIRENFNSEECVAYAEDDI